MDIKVQGASGERLDVYLTAETGRTRSLVTRLIKDGHITVNGAGVKCGYTVRDGDVIAVNEPQRSCDIEPENIPLDIVYEDGDIAVVNKQAGLSVHPSGKIRTNTLVNALMYRFSTLSGINGGERPGIVHRLDKDTTGLIIVAKNDAAHLSLSKQFASRSVKKLYRALLEGVVKDNNGTVSAAIARDPIHRKQMTVSRNGREAVSVYKVLERFEDATYAEFDIKTGRTHQIRVHAKAMGHPVIGDAAYGHKKQRHGAKSQLLHAYALEFIHPKTRKKMSFTAPLPADFETILEGKRREL